MIYLIVGLMGALLMFMGDMLLYYTPEDFDYELGKDLTKSIIDVMKKLPEKRVTIGGLIGPIASFMYCVGFYHIVLFSSDAWKTVAYITFFFLCIGIISGGAYHSHCAYLGLIGNDKFLEAREVVVKYFSKLAWLMYLGEGTGLLLLIILIATGNTILPQWMFILSPGVLFLLKKPIRRLPKGIRVIISGGWTNIISVIYYIAVIVYMF